MNTFTFCKLQVYFNANTFALLLKSFNAGLLLVTEYFYTVLLLLLHK